MYSESNEKVELVPSNTYIKGVGMAGVTEIIDIHGSGTIKSYSLSLSIVPMVIRNNILYVPTSAYADGDTRT